MGIDVKDMKVGDRVVVQPIIYDGTCPACKQGLINCCSNNGFIGLSGTFAKSFVRSSQYADLVVGWGGGLSQHVVAPRESVYHLPDNVPMEIGGEQRFRYQRVLRS